MKKYILVPFKEYHQQQEKIQHQGGHKRKKGTDGAGVAVVQPQNKRLMKIDFVKNKKRKRQEENTGSQPSGYQPPPTTNSDSFAPGRKRLPKGKEQFEEDKEEDEYPRKATRKFWIKP